MSDDEGVLINARRLKRTATPSKKALEAADSGTAKSAAPPAKKQKKKSGAEGDKQKKKAAAPEDGSEDETPELEPKKKGGEKQKAKEATKKSACKWAEAHMEEVGQRKNPPGKSSILVFDELLLVRVIKGIKHPTELHVGDTVTVWDKEKAKAEEKWTVYRISRAANASVFRLDLRSQASQRFLQYPLDFVTSIKQRDPKETEKEIQEHYQHEEKEFEEKEKKSKAEAEERKKKKVAAARASKAGSSIRLDSFGKVVRPADLQNALDKISSLGEQLAEVTAELTVVLAMVEKLRKDNENETKRLHARDRELWERSLSRP